VTVSLCLITKDEEQNIAACIESAREVVDEIILVDTGSKDNTVRIATGYGARIYNFPWSNDFAAAKNETLKHASGEWVLALDADERLDPTNCHRIRRLLEKPDYQAYLLQLICPYTINGSSQVLATGLSIRLFQNNIGMRYHGRLHENIHTRTTNGKTKVANTNISICHIGYIGNIEPKYRRNLSIIQQNKIHDAFLIFDLARIYYGLEQYPKALKELERGLKMNKASAWIRAQMYVLLGDTLMYMKQDSGPALSAWEKAAEIDEKIVAPRLRLGRAFYHCKEFKMASRQFERIVELISSGSLRGARLDEECTLAEAYNSLAACFLREGRREDAANVLVRSHTTVVDDEALKVIPWDSRN
jgi:tetratricopeptide (TPR) repeat protein